VIAITTKEIINAQLKKRQHTLPLLGHILNPCSCCWCWCCCIGGDWRQTTSETTDKYNKRIGIIMTTSSSITTTVTTLPWKYRLIEPHVAFVLSTIAVKLLLPSILKWLAHDTIATSILCVWYPLSVTICLIHRESQASTTTAAAAAKTTAPLIEDNNSNCLAAQDRQFWIDYWTVGYSLAQLIHQTILRVTPLHWNLSSSFQPQLLAAEFKFLFFVWIFALESLLQRYQRYLSLDKKKESLSYRGFTPLSLLKQLIRPRFLQVQSIISNPISKEHWHRFIHSQARKILNLLVALQILTEEWSDYFLQLLDECRSLLLLAPFLVLPSSITQVGILYVQFVLPSARSMLARGKIIQVLYLQYWVLNILWSTAVRLGSWMWWFVPFSTQAIFTIWCYLTFPRTITEYYAVVEQELITFGILSGESQLAVNETKTVQALRAVVARIPSANDAEGFRWAANHSNNSVESRYGPRSQRKLVPRTQSAPATLLAISAIKTLHDAAVLSPQNEDEGENEEEKVSQPEMDRAGGLSNLSKSLPVVKSDRFIDPLYQKNFITHADGFPPSVSMIEDSDEYSQVSRMAMVDIDLQSDNNMIYEEVQVTMKELSAARLKAVKYRSEPPARNTDNSRGKAAAFCGGLRSTMLHNMSDEPKMRPNLSSLVIPPKHSNRTASDTPRSNTSFELSDIDTAASFTGLEGVESFESADTPFEGSNRSRTQVVSPDATRTRKARSTHDDVARRAARRSERIRNLRQRREQRQVHQITKSLRLVPSASTDDSEGGARTVDSLLSETSSSTGNRAITNRDCDIIQGDRPITRLRRQRQRTSNCDRSVSESSYRMQHKSSLPRYVRVSSSDDRREGRVRRRSHSRDNTTLLATTDSDKVAQ
jgi:hypothetical protein